MTAKMKRKYLQIALYCLLLTYHVSALSRGRRQVWDYDYDEDDDDYDDDASNRNRPNRKLVKKTSRSSDLKEHTIVHVSPTEQAKPFRNIDNSDVSGSALISNETSFSNLGNEYCELSSDADETRFSDDFLSCRISKVEAGNFTKFVNSSVFISKYGKLLNESNYFFTVEGSLCVCSEILTEPEVENWKFSEILNVVTLTGAIISSLCIIIHIIMFFCLKRLRNLPGYCIFSLCIALLTAYTASVSPILMPESVECSSVGMILYYFFLSAFFWMNVLSYDVWRSLRLATCQLRLAKSRTMIFRFSLYSAYSWLSPILIVLISLIINSVSENPAYMLQFNRSSCWFDHKQAVLLYVALPIFSLMTVNVFFYGHSFYMISSASMKSSESKAELLVRFLISFRLAAIMGLTWIFAILATSTQVIELFYVSEIFNTLQGVFIFCSFTLTEKTRKAFKKALLKQRSSVCPSKTQVTTV